MTPRVSLLCDELRQRGERITRPRRHVLDALTRSTRHLTADEVLAAVQRDDPTIHRATVYRTLETFRRIGLVEHTHLGHGPAVYHLIDDLHQHLVCEHCGRVVEAPSSLFQSVERELRDDYGFVMRPMHFAVVGRCRRCTNTLT